MNIKELLLYIILILTIILLLKYLTCNCNCIEGLENNKKKKLKSINKQNSKLIKQIIKVNKHDVDKVRSDNLKKGVNKEHPFVDLPPSALKYLVAFPNKIKSKSKGKSKRNKKNTKPKVLKENFENTENSPKTYTNDISHELGDIRNQGLIGICWAITIVEAIDSAYYNQTGNIFRSSIQQLMDCLVDLDGVDYDDLYFGIDSSDTGILYVQNLYRDSQRNIYSEEEYPSILDNCYIPTDVDELTFCSGCNNSYDILYASDPDPDSCDNVIEKCRAKPNTTGYDEECQAINSEEECVSNGIRPGVVSSYCEWTGFTCELEFCNTCDYSGYCDKYCEICTDNICNNNDNNGCETFVDSDGYRCTNSIQNICIQGCRTDITPNENITVRDIIFLQNVNDKTIYNNLINNTLICYIYVTEDMMLFNSTNCYVTFAENSDTDPNLSWNTDYVLSLDHSADDTSWRNINDYSCNDYYKNPSWCLEAEDYPSEDNISATTACPSVCNYNVYNTIHVVVIIGSVYKTNGTLPEDKRSSTSDGRYFWVLRNSWGSEWGDNGHFYVERDVNDERFNGNASLLSIYEGISYITLNIE